MGLWCEAGMHVRFFGCARRVALRPLLIACIPRNGGCGARLCEIGAFLGGGIYSLRTGGNPSARGVAVCDWNQYQYGIVISHYTHVAGA